MLGQKCANCGYKMNFTESVLVNILKSLGDVFESSASKAVGMNTVSNANKLKCPKCGEYGRWIREDEE